MWRVLMKRLRFLLRPGRVEHDIEREVAFHLDMEAGERVQTGMSPGFGGGRQAYNPTAPHDWK